MGSILLIIKTQKSKQSSTGTDFIFFAKTIFHNPAKKNRVANLEQIAISDLGIGDLKNQVITKNIKYYILKFDHDFVFIYYFIEFQCDHNQSSLLRKMIGSGMPRTIYIQYKFVLLINQLIIMKRKKWNRLKTIVICLHMAF